MKLPTIAEFKANPTRLLPVSFDWEDMMTFSPIDLMEPQTFFQIYATALDPRYDYEPTNASYFEHGLRKLVEAVPDFAQQNRALFNNYQVVLNYLEVLAFPVLPEKRITKVFRERLLQMLDWQIDVRQKIFTTYSMKNFIFDVMLPLRNAMLRGMRENSQPLGTIQIEPSRPGSSPEPPVVKNWLVDYDSFFEKENMLRASVEQTTYINRNLNVRKLSGSDRQRLLQILRIYDYLLTPTGEEVEPVHELPEEQPLETPGPAPASAPASARQVSTPAPTVVPPRATEPAPTSEKLDKISADYKGHPEEEKEIADLEKRLIEETKSDPSVLEDRLFQAINGMDKKAVVALLRALARQKNLAVAITGEDPLTYMFQGYLQAKFGQEVLEDFKKNPQQPVYISAFLQYVLKDKLSISPTNSARVAIRLANIYAGKGDKRFLTMAYGDLSSGEFAWNEIVKEGNALRIREVN